MKKVLVLIMFIITCISFGKNDDGNNITMEAKGMLRFIWNDHGKYSKSSKFPITGISARYFYEGIVTSDKARNYQDYIDFQCQTYRKTKSRKDWQEVKRLTKEYEDFLAKEVDIKRKLLLFGLMKRDQKERQSVYLLLVKKYHLERWV